MQVSKCGQLEVGDYCVKFRGTELMWCNHVRSDIDVFADLLSQAAEEWGSAHYKCSRDWVSDAQDAIINGEPLPPKSNYRMPVRMKKGMRRAIQLLANSI